MLEPKNKRSIAPHEARLQYLLHLIKKKRRSSGTIRAMLATYYADLADSGKKEVRELLQKERSGLFENMTAWFDSGSDEKRSVKSEGKPLVTRAFA